jgi:hypothetical protein
VPGADRLIVPDYVQDLDAMAKKALKFMAEYGGECRIGQT